MAWTTPRTWVTGEVVTAILLNPHLRDNLVQTAPFHVTTDGDMLVATGANALERVAVMDASNRWLQERGGLEADLSTVTTGDILAGQSAGVVGLETAMSQAEAEAGTDTQVRGVTAERIKQAIDALDAGLLSAVAFSRIRLF